MQEGVYGNAVQMMELDLLLKKEWVKNFYHLYLFSFIVCFPFFWLKISTNIEFFRLCRCKDYWKQRLADERAEMVKQSKIYWETQTKYMIGYWMQKFGALSQWLYLYLFKNISFPLHRTCIGPHGIICHVSCFAKIRQDETLNKYKKCNRGMMFGMMAWV